MISTVDLVRDLTAHLVIKLGTLQVYRPGDAVAKPTEHEFVVPRIRREDPAESGRVPLEIEFLCVLPTLRQDQRYLDLPALVDKVRPHVLSTRGDAAAAAEITDGAETPSTLGLLYFGAGTLEWEYGTEIKIERQTFANVDVCRITVECTLAPNA